MRRGVVDSALADASADAFVHVGPPGDPTVQYFCGTALPCRAAVVYGGRVAVVPERSLPDHVTSSLGEDATVLDPHPTPAECLPGLASGAVLAPRSLPHDAALYLENDGIDVSSTDAHERARAVKTDSEQAAIEDAQAAAGAGISAVAELLATAEQADDRDSTLTADGVPVTAERVRRTANEAMARAGATPETVVEASGALDAAKPISVRATPTVDGYRGLLARTFVADSDGGWERRATLACEYAIDAALDIVEPGETTVAEAEAEATAELGSYGFPPEAGSADVHGLGLERREAPTGDATVEKGMVLAVTTRLDDEGEVLLADVGVAGEDRVERVGVVPRSVVPKTDY